MQLSELSIHHLRNLTHVHLRDLGQVNLILGDNGSGKTSLLEAIHLLATTRSFRTRQTRAVVQTGADALVVAGRVQRTPDASGERLGVERAPHRPALVKHNGTRLYSVGELAGFLPVQVIDSAGFSLLEGAPENRRQLLDWCVFHVKQRAFYAVWRRYRRALQQRNALLRDRVPAGVDYEAWDREVSECGEQLHRLRAEQFAALEPLLVDALASMPDADIPRAVTFRYAPGWDTREALGDHLKAHFERDLALGYTRNGPHRADIRVRLDGQPATDVLSRGQLKTVLCCIRLAQAKLLQQYGIKSVFLIDDLPAELDAARRQAFCAQLLPLGLQLFVTSIEARDLEGCFPDVPAADQRVFHVKHGVVKSTPG